jgi:hypothetical protein
MGEYAVQLTTAMDLLSAYHFICRFVLPAAQHAEGLKA